MKGEDDVVDEEKTENFQTDTLSDFDKKLIKTVPEVAKNLYISFQKDELCDHDMFMDCY